MRASRAVLLLCGVLVLSACGKHESASPRTSAPRSTAATSAARHLAATPAAQGAQASKLARKNDDGSETVENATGDNGSHNPLLAAVASTVAVATPAASADVLTAPTPWQDGVNYTRMVPAQPTDVPAGQVEVLEFFWYACPHCASIDPQVEAWRKSKPAYVSFVRVPVTWTDGHRALARLYYTLESLGKLEQSHAEVFKEIQVNGDSLVARDPSDAAETERMQATFARKLGISEDSFRQAYHSFSVDNNLPKADILVQRYRIDGVPTFVVNGKYIADVRSAGSPERLLSLVGDLAAQEHKH